MERTIPILRRRNWHKKKEQESKAGNKEIRLTQAKRGTKRRKKNSKGETTAARVLAISGGPERRLPRAGEGTAK